MIVSKTPLRISFFSGGSDLPSFYEKEQGAALSITIDKFIYVCAHKTPYMDIKVMYDEVEHVAEVEQMQHAITRETLKHFNLTKEITIASISDILSKGSGLGSSSAFTVGLIKALTTIRNTPCSEKFLADTACEIEMNKCCYPVGKQDQYAAAFGGLNIFEFLKNGNVDVHKCKVDKKTLNKLENNLLLVYSGVGRDANNILQKQSKAMAQQDKFELVRRSRNKAYSARDFLINNDVDSFGSLLHDAWMDKKSVVSDITQDYFDVVYEKAMSAGSLGGKLLGAGGGGFFIFYVPIEKREKVSKEITTDTKCKIYDFKFCNQGSTLLLM